MRFDLCTHLVPFPVDFEEPLLYHLPHFQLGSSDDVYTHAFSGQLLYKFAAFAGCGGVDGVGILRAHPSGAFLV